ncbi:hypothetical protein RF11_08649 [Thelohanellus kitauei]|uniref:Myb-like domain-containing protein n=1 Tax=Thelohanellus kitauei TaxID=669202 RepID=A0A0C2J328_THEKT|nr:hypothetical protein RF11_08649 [Thelohanellus kitauei]
MCKKYQLTSDDIDEILINFKEYVIEFKVDDIRDFLALRKSTNKETIKDTNLKRKLNYVYRKLMKAIRKSQTKVDTSESSNARTRPSKWSSDELQQLRKNIDKICQIYEISDWSKFVLDTSPHMKKFKASVKIYCQLGIEYVVCSGESSWQIITSKGTVGKWEKSECKRLRKAIRKIMNVPRKTIVYKNIPWVRVSEFVKTRSPQDCYMHWYKRLSKIYHLLSLNKKAERLLNVAHRQVGELKSDIGYYNGPSMYFPWDWPSKNYDGNYRQKYIALHTLLMWKQNFKSKNGFEYGNESNLYIQMIMFDQACEH